MIKLQTSSPAGEVEGRVQPSKEEVELMCCGLPPVLRGVGEVVRVLRWPDEFVRTWLQGSASVPAIPHYMAGRVQIFYTSQLVRWQAMYWPGRKVEFRGGPPDGGSTKRQAPSTRETSSTNAGGAE